MKSVFVIWEYEQGSPFDREEPLYPFYLSRFLAEQALKKLGPEPEWGYREIREERVSSEVEG